VRLNSEYISHMLFRKIRRKIYGSFYCVRKRRGRYKLFCIIREIFIFEAVHRKIKYLVTRISSTYEHVASEYTIVEERLIYAMISLYIAKYLHRCRYKIASKRKTKHTRVKHNFFRF